jgi:2-C-methyl-D-erythritol 4-phosphate cytidylyltransferase
MRDTAAIIVAGGKGLRFGGRTRKQYVSLNGRPIFWWSLRAFQKCASIAEIILVVPANDLKRVVVAVPKKIRVVAGGTTRADSVRHGLKAISPAIRWVAVHDAVRPLITPSIIEAVIRAARRHRAAIAATPSRDTVKIANGHDTVKSTPERDKVWLAQTPQVFERELLERAHAKGCGATVTDDAQLVERLGVKVKLVEAPADNIKITRPIDLELAKCIVSE